VFGGVQAAESERAETTAPREAALKQRRARRNLRRHAAARCRRAEIRRQPGRLKHRRARPSDASQQARRADTRCSIAPMTQPCSAAQRHCPCAAVKASSSGVATRRSGARARGVSRGSARRMPSLAQAARGRETRAVHIKAATTARMRGGGATGCGARAGHPRASDFWETQHRLGARHGQDAERDDAHRPDAAACAGSRALARDRRRATRLRGAPASDARGWRLNASAGYDMCAPASTSHTTQHRRARMRAPTRAPRLEGVRADALRRAAPAASPQGTRSDAAVTASQRASSTSGAPKRRGAGS